MLRSTNARPMKTPLARVAEGTETPMFKDCFADWPRGAAAARCVFAVCCSVLQRVAACCSVLQCGVIFLARC